MEISITSREMVKPTCEELVLHPQPFKLSVLDQLMPTFYLPVVFFYTQPYDSHPNGAKLLVDQLKQSLSKVLNRLYPLSGREMKNMYVSCYEEGVTFVEAKVNGCLSGYLGQQETIWMNELLPCKPFTTPLLNQTVPLLAIQVNLFDCGGIALALCFCHKLIDGSTLSCFLKTWAAFTRGERCEDIPETPNPKDSDLLHAASRLFPPLESIPPCYVSFIQSLLITESRCKTKTFVFDADAIATLKLKAKGNLLKHPSRVAALTAFVLKHAILASRSASGVSKPALLGQAVNLRPRMKPQLPNYSIGNLFWFSIVGYDSTDEEDIELHELAYLAKEGVKGFENDHLDLLQDDASRFLAMSEPLVEQIHEVIANGNAEYYAFSSWLNLVDGKGVDFGWGEPSLYTIPKVDTRNGGCRYNNGCFFKDVIGQPGAIQAWITLEEKAIGVLEQDPEFLQFASPTPY